jgi:hypothetical protein
MASLRTFKFELAAPTHILLILCQPPKGHTNGDLTVLPDDFLHFQKMTEDLGAITATEKLLNGREPKEVPEDVE